MKTILELLMDTRYDDQYFQNGEMITFANQNIHTYKNKKYSTYLKLLKKKSTITSSSMMCWSFVFVVLVKNIVLIVSIICHLTSIFFKYFYLSMLASAVD